MKNKTINVAIAVAVIIFGIIFTCLTLTNSTGNAVDHQSALYGNSDVASVFSDNRDLLMKYVDTPSNFAITLLGLDGIVSDIRDAAGSGLELIDKCAELIYTGDTVHQELLDFNKRFLECNTRTLEVKKSLDVGSFQTALNNTLLTIKEYNTFLEELSENTGG